MWGDPSQMGNAYTLAVENAVNGVDPWGRVEIKLYTESDLEKYLQSEDPDICMQGQLLFGTAILSPTGRVTARKEKDETVDDFLRFFGADPTKISPEQRAQIERGEWVEMPVMSASFVAAGLHKQGKATQGNKLSEFMDRCDDTPDRVIDCITFVLQYHELVPQTATEQPEPETIEGAWEEGEEHPGGLGTAMERVLERKFAEVGTCEYGEGGLTLKGTPQRGDVIKIGSGDTTHYAIYFGKSTTGQHYVISREGCGGLFTISTLERLMTRKAYDPATKRVDPAPPESGICHLWGRSTRRLSRPFRGPQEDR